MTHLNTNCIHVESIWLKHFFKEVLDNIDKWEASAEVRGENTYGSLERSSDFSNNGEFKRQTASEIAILIRFFLQNCSRAQSFSHGFINKLKKKKK